MRCKHKTVLLVSAFLVILLVPCVKAALVHVTRSNQYFPSLNSSTISFDSSIVPLVFDGPYRDSQGRWHFNNTWVTTTTDLVFVWFNETGSLNYTVSAGGTQQFGCDYPNTVIIDGSVKAEGDGWSYSGSTLTITDATSSAQIVFVETPVSPPPDTEETSYFNVAYERHESFQFQVQSSPNAYLHCNVTSGTLHGTGTLNYTESRGEIIISPSTSGTLTLRYPSGLTVYVNATSYSSPISFIPGSPFNITWLITSTNWLIIHSIPLNVTFSLNGSTQITTFERVLIDGTYVAVFPNHFVREEVNWTFVYWTDTHNSNPSRTIILESTTEITAYYATVLYPTEMQPTFAYDMSGYIIDSDRIILLDSSIYKNYGTTANSSTAPLMKLAALGYGLHFDGINDYISIPCGDGNVLTNLFTLTVHINVEEANRTQYIINNPFQYQLYINSNNTLTFSTYDDLAGWRSATSTSTLSLNTWYFVAGIYNTSDTMLYIDNTRVANVSVSGSFTTENNTIYVGARTLTTPQYYFKGVIDELQVHQRVLTSTNLIIIRYAQIKPASIIELLTGTGDYGLNNNYLETPWVNGTVTDSTASITSYLYGFAKHRSKITINQTDDYGVNNNITWSYSLYKRGLKQVTYYIQLRCAGISVNWWMARFGIQYGDSSITYGDWFTLNLNGSYAQIKLSVEAWNDKGQSKFGLRLTIDDVFTMDNGERVTEWFYDHKDADGNNRHVQWFDPLVKVIVFVGANTAYISVITHENFGFLALVAALIIGGIIAAGTVYYLASIGNPVAQSIVQSVFQPVLDALWDLAGQIAEALRPVGEWIIEAVIDKLNPLFTAMVNVGIEIANALIYILDVMFGWFGWENGFSQILSFISNFFSQLPTMVANFISFMFSMLETIVAASSVLVGLFVAFFNTLSGTYDILLWIWNGTLPYWGWIPGMLQSLFPLLAFFFLLWLFEPIIVSAAEMRNFDTGIEKTKNRIENTIGWLWKMAMFAWKIVDFLINTISRIIEALPVIE